MDKLITNIRIETIQDAEEILKSIEENSLEFFDKARNVGDVLDVKGKTYVWTEYKPGKFDWRLHGGRAHSKAGAAAKSEAATTTKTTNDAKSNKTTQKVNTDKIDITLDWSKYAKVDYETKKLINAITDKYKNSLNNGNKPSFSDTAYDYLVNGGYDDEEATDLSYEFEDIFNKVSMQSKSSTKKDSKIKVKEKSNTVQNNTVSISNITKQLMTNPSKISEGVIMNTISSKDVIKAIQSGKIKNFDTIRAHFLSKLLDARKRMKELEYSSVENFRILQLRDKQEIVLTRLNEIYDAIKQALNITT